MTVAADSLLTSDDSQVTHRRPGRSYSKAGNPAACGGRPGVNNHLRSSGLLGNGWREDGHPRSRATLGEGSRIFLPTCALRFPF